MSFRNWVLVAALGLAATFVLGFGLWATGYELGKQDGKYQPNAYASQNHTAQEVRRACGDTDIWFFTECATKVIEATSENQRAEVDLEVQKDVARYTFWGLVVASAVAVLGIGGIYFTWRGVVATRHIGMSQTRAYVEVAGVDFYWGSANLQSPYFKLLIANHGATPAKWFQIRQRYTIYEHGVSGPPDTFEGLTLPQGFGGRWNGVNPNEKRMTTAGPEITNPREINKCHLGTPRVGYNPPDNTHGVVVFGEIRYCTIFDEVFVSQFVFGAGSLLAFKSEEPVEIDRREGGRVTRVVREVTEIPQKLTRLPIALDLYRKERP